MNQAIHDYKSFKQAKEEKTSDIEVDKIDTGQDWFTWKESFTGLLELKTGVGGSPLARCIRENKPAGWTPDQATNPLERLIYELPLTGNEYEVDNASAWSEIKKVTLGTPTYEWIRQYDATKNGRGAWFTILGQCKGDSAMNKRLLIANKTINLEASSGGAFYTNEYQEFTFEKYATKIMKAYAIIERYRNYVAPETKVEQLLAGINVQNAPAINNAKEYIKDHLLGDWVGAVTYMATKITKQFPPRTAGQKRRDRQASQVDSRGRGRGRGGRDGRGGRGGRYGRGGGRQGRGGAHGGRGRGHAITFGGVDVSDPSYNFSNEEMTRMGKEGRDYIFEQRNRYRQGRHGSRGGRGGRHNSGYDGGRGGYNERQIQAAGSERDGNEQQGTNNSQALVVYDRQGSGQDNNEQRSSADHRAMEGRGGRAGVGFGRGAYGRGGR